MHGVVQFMVRSVSTVELGAGYQIDKLEENNAQPAGASAMTWSSTYVLLVLLILPKTNLTCSDLTPGS